MNELPYIPGVPNTLRDESSDNPKNKPHCTNPRHAAPAGWCPTCDAEWDHTDKLTEEQLSATNDQDLADALVQLAEANMHLRKLKAAEPRDVVAVVEQRKGCRAIEERIRNMGYLVNGR